MEQEIIEKWGPARGWKAVARGNAVVLTDTRTGLEAWIKVTPGMTPQELKQKLTEAEWTIKEEAERLKKLDGIRLIG